jgi:hypothetical protein
MHKRSVCTMVQCLAVVSLGAQPPSPSPFLSSVTAGDNVLDVKVADAILRSDGRWLTFGSRTTSGPNGRETAILVLREVDGSPIAVRELVLDGPLSYRPMSMAAIGAEGDVVVVGIEYDTSGSRNASLTRVNAALEVVWSTRLSSPTGVFDWPRLVSQEPSQQLLLVGEVRRMAGGSLGDSDALLSTVGPDGSVSDVRTLATTSAYERIVDARVSSSDGSTVLLTEVARERGQGVESGDGLVVVDREGSIADVRLIGHSMAPGIRARALRLLPHDDGGWVIAGRRTAFGPNVFYLHKVTADLSPEPSRTLIPFFNVIDMDARDGNFWVYGEANGEIMDTGTVLMGFDSALQMVLQRRYATENTVFPTGAFEFSSSGALLALGARRLSDDGFAYESSHHVALPSGQGVLCEEGDYTGFSTVADPTTLLSGWQPAATPFQAVTTDAVASMVPVAASKVDLCVRE